MVYLCPVLVIYGLFYGNSAMSFEIISSSTHTTLTLAGDINIASSSDLRGQLSTIPASLDLVVHSSELVYIDSSGVACLIMAYKRLKEGGATIRLVQPSDALMNVLKILKFDSLFTIE